MVKVDILAPRASNDVVATITHPNSDGITPVDFHLLKSPDRNARRNWNTLQSFDCKSVPQIDSVTMIETKVSCLDRTLYYVKYANSQANECPECCNLTCSCDIYIHE